MQDGSEDEAESTSEQKAQPKHRKLVRSPLKESEKLWVTATTCLILFLVVSVQALLIIPYFVYDMYHTPFDTFKILASLLIPFNIGAALILTNYYRCVTLDPGSVPIDWQPPSDAFSNSPELPRYCRPCKRMKPPRTHHCRTCRRCTLRMDHHCPWIANCVGQRNYASFIRFLAAVDITCAAHLVLCSLRTADYWWVKQGAAWRAPSTTIMVVLVLNFCLCLPTFLLVGSFSIYHFWCLCTNTTTIEGWERDKVETMISKRRIEEIDYPFDLGVLANVQSVLGRSPLQWCIPSLTCGDGLRYNVGEGIDPNEQYYWPPKDPRREARENKKRAKLPSSGPFTYGNGSFNPALRPTNSKAGQKQAHSDYPPWHPNFGRSLDEEGDEEDEEEEADAAQASGVDFADSCMPPVTKRGKEEESEGGSMSSSEEETTRTMTKSRIRRGSEGYEVRPKRFEVAYAALSDGEEEDDDERDKLGFDEYNNEEEDDKEWDWRRRQEEEDKLRQMIEEDMRAAGPVVLHDPPADWQQSSSSTTTTSSPSVLLPSQVMRRRSQWQDFIKSENIVESGDDD